MSYEKAGAKSSAFFIRKAKNKTMRFALQALHTFL